MLRNAFPAFRLAASAFRLGRAFDQGRSDVGGSQAFTLLELLLVLAMLAAVIGVAMPSLKPFFRSRNLDAEARRFLSLTRYGQSRAVSEGVPLTLWIDTKQGAYGLQTQAGYLDSDDKAVEFAVHKDVKVEVAAGDVAAPARLLHQNAAAAGSWNPARRSGHASMIRFTPDGFVSETSPTHVVFRQDANDALWIVLSTNRLGYEIRASQPPSPPR